MRIPIIYKQEFPTEKIGFFAPQVLVSVFQELLNEISTIPDAKVIVRVGVNDLNSTEIDLKESIEYTLLSVMLLNAQSVATRADLVLRSKGYMRTMFKVTFTNDKKDD